MSFRKMKNESSGQFFQIEKGPIKFDPKTDDLQPWPHGSCGHSPDQILINREPEDYIDSMGDKYNWSGERRKIERSVLVLKLAALKINNEAKRKMQIHYAQLSWIKKFKNRFNSL